MIVGDGRMVKLHPGKQDRETVRYESKTDTRHRHSKECLFARDDSQKGMQQPYRIKADGEAKKESAHCCGILPGSWQAAPHTAEVALTHEYASIIQATWCFHKERARVLDGREFFRSPKCLAASESPSHSSWASAAGKRATSTGTIQNGVFAIMHR